ncbi:MAG: hypothetical protein ACREXR_13390 [Gammaproteobacteria bacterium]
MAPQYRKADIKGGTYFFTVGFYQTLRHPAVQGHNGCCDREIERLKAH